MSEQAEEAALRPSPGLRYVQYDGDKESLYLSAIRQLISKDLSEPYSIYVYRYFLYQWGDLCFMVRPVCMCLFWSLISFQALDEQEKLVGVVISKLETHRGGPLRGYIAMLAVREEHRGKGIATRLVRMAIDTMIDREADEVGYLNDPSSVSPLTRCRLPSRPKSPTQQP